MSWATANYGYWEFWAPYDPQQGFYGNQKCIFDGENKLIYVNPNESIISIKEDVYSGWKEWVSVRDNSKFPPAIRTTGGDPIPGTNQFTGDTYFLINDWRFLIDHSLNIDGVIYSDNFPSPFIQQDGTQIVTNKVSALVQTVTTESIGGITVPTAQEIRQEMDASSTRLISIDSKVQTLQNGPGVAEIRQEMDDNSTKLATIQSNTSNIPSAFTIAAQVRTELAPELARIDAPITSIQGGLTNTQAIMLLEMYELLGLDPTKPLLVTQTQRIAGDITQNITTSNTQTTVTRV